jgi:hypothetical protein
MTAECGRIRQLRLWRRRKSSCGIRRPRSRMTRPDNGDKPSYPLVHHRKIVSRVLGQPALPEEFDPLLVRLGEFDLDIDEA